MKTTIYNYPKKIWPYFSKKRKKELIFSFLLMIFSSFADLVSIASVLPFLYVITSNPESLWENEFLRNIFKLFLINEPNQLFLPVTIFFILTAIFSGIIKILYLWFNSKISGIVGSELSTEAYRKVLNQSYAYHLNENSNNVISAISQHINKNTRCLQNYLDFIGSALTNIFIVIGLIAINWIIAVNSLLIFGFAYYIIINFARDRLLKNSKRIAISNDNQIKIVSEGIGSIRELILYQLQKSYLNKYKNNDFPMRRLEAQQTFLTSFSKYLLETLALLFIAFITVSIYFLSKETNSIIPTLGAIALCIQKLLPGLQKSYACFAQIKSVWASVEIVVGLLNLPINESKNINIKENLIIKRNDSIKIQEVSYCYPNSDRNVISDLTLDIKIGTSLGIIGRTGEGKSTLLDLLMGLIIPTKGEIKIGKNNLNNHRNLLLWRNSIAHVPQDIYLSDTSIAQNIALSLEDKLIDYERLKFAAKSAFIHEFIVSTKNGYKTLVGERGILLSGGQKQRIGIARAIYKSAKVLIFDEATSSLDKKTEQDVINSIKNYNQNLTLIMVAHNLKTLESCDRIIRIKNGKLEEDGSPNEILPKFR